MKHLYKLAQVAIGILLVATVLIPMSQSAGLCKNTSEKDKAKKKSNGAQNSQKEKSMDAGKIYTFKANGLDGKEIDFGKYKGDVMLIVNTASECGFTPQFTGLEALHKKYDSKGLKVLGFPCNQFGGQEPGNSGQIGTFCKKNYGVDFQMFEKIDVNGKDAHPIYKYLTEEKPGVMGSEAIKWNFTKFLIDRNGKVVKRFAPSVKPEDIDGEISKLL